MDFDFSEEQKAIRDEARRMLNAQCDLRRVRRVLDGELGFDRDLWNTVAGLGWLGTAIPEQHGGLGLGHVTLCVLAEELGRALSPLPVIGSVYLLAEALMLAGSPQQQAEWLPQIADGRVVGTTCLGDAGKSLRGSKPELRYLGSRVQGSSIANDALFADMALVRAADAQGRELMLLVRLQQDSVRREALVSLDPTCPIGRLHFDAAEAEVLTEREVPALLARLLDRAAVLVAFEQLGGAQRLLETSCDYARLRHAFGRPIGSFQAIKHKLADMYTKIELARANAFYGAWALDADAPALPLAAAAARLSATEAYEFAAKEAIQTHGGFGATWEADLHLFYRRSKVLMARLDSPPSWRNRLVDSLAETFSERMQ